MSAFTWPTCATNACGSTVVVWSGWTGSAIVPPWDSTTAVPWPCSWVVNRPCPLTAPRTAPRIPPWLPRNTSVAAKVASWATSRSASTVNGPAAPTSMIVRYMPR